MLKLIKYELRKTWMTKAIILCIAAIAEISYLIGLYAEKNITTTISILALVMLAFGGIIVIGLQSILTLHRDMNTKESYMLFMTPNSCYKILGAKVIEFGISTFLGSAFFFALGGLDITLLFAKEGQLSQLWTEIQSFLSGFSVNGHSIEVNLPSLASVTFVMVSAWISLIVTAYLAVVISAALLNGKRFNGLISFVIFLIINWAAGRVAPFVTSSIQDNVALLVTYGAINLAIAVIMYFVTAQIMERRLSV